MRMLGCSIGELKESSFQWPRGQCLIVNVGISKHYLGSIKLNEQEFTLKYQLTGKGVEWLRQSDPYLIRLHDWAEAHNGQLLKIHLAFDDTSGKYNIRRAEKDYSAGYYDPERGARPKKGKQGDKANGQTLTIGSLDAVCHVCIYEKDKELGLPVNSELFGKWVRHELKLRHIQRKPLVLDMLVQPAAYFKARYKAHNKMLKKVRGLKLPRLINISTSLDLAKRFKWLRRQCGPFIQFNRQIGIDAETFVNMAAREGNQNQYHQHKLLQKEEVLELYQEFCQGFIDEEERV